MMTARKSRMGVPVRIVTVVALALLTFSIVQGASLRARNLTQLIDESEQIVEGTVVSVTDGIDANGLPYTEVTVFVRSSAKGTIEDESHYTFRQFGLLEPRKLDDGRLMMALSPDGFAQWREGESFVAFLHRPASRSGLQTTAGLAQGKLTRFDSNTRLANEFGNVGLFDGVEINPALLTPAEHNMLTTPGPVDAEVFMGLVHRAVSEQWIENGEMH